MLTTRWNAVPAMRSELNRLYQEMDQLFNVRNPRTFPALNVWEDEDGYFVEAELPGVREEDLEITVSDGSTLTIEGERKTRGTDAEKYRYRERGTGKFKRTIELPDELDSDAVNASLVDGVLTITLPRRAELKPKKVVVSVGRSTEESVSVEDSVVEDPPSVEESNETEIESDQD